METQETKQDPYPGKRALRLEEIKPTEESGMLYWLEFRGIFAPAMMVEQSEYIGGPLDELADLFMKALRTDDPHEKNRLIDEWNKKTNSSIRC